MLLLAEKAKAKVRLEGALLGWYVTVRRKVPDQVARRCRQPGDDGDGLLRSRADAHLDPRHQKPGCGEHQPLPGHRQ